MTDYNKITNLLNDNTEKTDNPSITSSYYYIGSYTGGYDVIDGILDNLLVDGLEQQDVDSVYENTDQTISDTCEHDECSSTIDDNENKSTDIISETPVIYTYSDSEYVYSVDGDDYNMVKNESDSPLVIDIEPGQKLKGSNIPGGAQHSSVSKKNNNANNVKYADVHKFITSYIETLDDKTYKENR